MPKKSATKVTFDEKKIEAYALANAIAHGGKARVESVLPKLFQEGLLKEQIREVMPLIQQAVKKINSLKLEEQQKRFQELANLVKKREIREGLPPLPNAQQGKVVMRFAPFPSGPLHIGNAKAVILNDEYCKMYKGKLLLVIDDTIGSEEKQIIKDSYKLIPEGLDWLQVKYVEPIVYKSDRMNLYYSYADQLIRKKKAYVCFCDAETLHKNRVEGKECEHRNYDVVKNLEEWQNMLDFDYKPGEATLRIKTDMKHKNPAFRDRVIFRISDRNHPRTGKKYRVWPMLDFSWAIDDHFLGITHILRGKELMIESEMEKYIWDIFGWKHPEIIHSGLIQLEGEGIKISKSKSAKEVLEGTYSGWDDPRTWSLQSLARRGIRPEAIRTFILSQGLTQTEAKVPVENLYKENKKFVEQSNRYFFIANPIEITVKSAPRMKAKVPLHPDYPKRGYRNFDTFDKFYITEDDYKKMLKGKNYRFMHLFNFVKSNYFEFISKEYDEKLDAKLIHWLPVIKELVKTEVLMPNGSIVKGLAEPKIRELKIGELCQFERFGFVRCDSKTKDKMVFWFGHG